MDFLTRLRLNAVLDAEKKQEHQQQLQTAEQEFEVYKHERLGELDAQFSQLREEQERLHVRQNEFNRQLQDAAQTFAPLGKKARGGYSDSTNGADVVQFNYTKTMAYNKHWFTSFAYGIATQTTQDLITDLKFPQIPETLILQPTTNARIEFDDTDVTSTTPIVLANSNVSWPLHVAFIHVQGVSAGTLNLYGFYE